MDFSFILTFFEKVANMTQILFDWFGDKFSLLGVDGSYTILGLLGGVGLVGLITYSVLKP